MIGKNVAVCFGVFAGFLSVVSGLQCFQCGMYNDGVGSITPCLNHNHTKLIECPKPDHRYCIVSNVFTIFIADRYLHLLAGEGTPTYHSRYIIFSLLLVNKIFLNKITVFLK